MLAVSQTATRLRIINSLRLLNTLSTKPNITRYFFFVTMSANSSSRLQSGDNEKRHDSSQKAIIETGVVDTVDVDKDDVSQDLADGDDALKLAGSHAKQFDEKYYLRLRRKIASILLRPGKDDEESSNCVTSGPPCDANSCLCLLYTILG